MEEKKNQKLSYEELENVASQLSQQNQQLNMMLQQANMGNMFKRVDYLFNVLKYKDCFNSDFVISCSEEIEKFLTINPEEGEEEVKKED